MSNSLRRRGFLKGALAVGAVGSLAACAGGSSDDNDPTTDPSSNTGSGDGGNGAPQEMDKDNPFGYDGGEVEAVIFNGGYGIDYGEFAGQMMSDLHEGATVNVVGSTQIAQEMQPRLNGGNPPSVFDNAGAGKLSLAAVIDQLEDLNDLVDAPNYEGEVIRDTLIDGVLEPSTVGDKLAAINYVLTVYAIWYSKSLFDENGWEPPKTWDEAKELGEKAKEQGKFLFLWGQEAAGYYIDALIASAVKEGGLEVRDKLETLAEDAWSHDAIQQVFTKFKEIIDAGLIKPGGSGTQFTAAQAQWSNNQEALLYPSGAWIENEMKDQTKEGFEMVGAPVPTVSDSPQIPYEGIQLSAAEEFMVPSGSPNVPGGKEFMRAMLSKEAASNFAETILSPTIVADTVPADGYGSSALVSQTEMIAAAGENSFTWQFGIYYGMGQEHTTLMNSFLDGNLDVAKLTSELQAITDRKREETPEDKRLKV